jgi:hypothetical protein
MGNLGPLKQKYPSAYYCYRQDYGYPIHHYMMADGIQTQHSTKEEVIHYTVETYAWESLHISQEPFWRNCGTGPGGNTIDAAHKRVKEDIDRMKTNGHFDPSTIKIVIKKTVSTEQNVEVLTGSDFTAFMLKTA